MKEKIIRKLIAIGIIILIAIFAIRVYNYLQTEFTKQVTNELTN